MLSLKDELRRKDSAETMEVLRLKRALEDRDALVQNLQGVREALEGANIKVVLTTPVTSSLEVFKFQFKIVFVCIAD